jgi:hypothetical protein
VDLLSNSNFFKYWGKAKQPIEVDYALVRGSDAEIAACYHLNEAQLQQKARKLGWQRASPEQPLLSIVVRRALPLHKKTLLFIELVC